MPFWNEKTSVIPPTPAGINSTLEKGQVMAGRVKSDVPPLERLRQAAGKGDARSVTDLLDQGININSDKDKDGRTLLHIAAQNGHVDVVRALVTRGYDTSSKDVHGYTPMHRAAAQGHLEVISFLVKNGCPIDEEDECGNTALHAAAWNGFSQTIDLLLRNKARVNAVNKAGFTALHSSAQKGHNQSARVLLFAGCQPNIKNKYAETALHTSARYGHAGVARILLSAKCKVNIQNKNGETALHVAVVCKRQKIAKLLVEAGIKKKLKNKQGETALEISRKMNDLEMILILTSQEKQAIVIRRHRSEDIRQLSSPAEDTISDTKSDSSRKHRRDNQSRQETDKENYQTIGSCVAGPAAAAGAKATKSSCAAVPSGAMTASNRLLFDSIDAPEKLLDRFKQHQLEKQMKQLPNTAAPNKHSKNEKMTKDVLCEHAAKPGQMYYRDLSGKVKQGPVGCASVYEAGPALLQKERKSNADHEAVYEPIASARDYQKAEKCCHRRLPNQQGNGGVHGRNSCTTLSRVQKSAMSVEGRRSHVQSEPRLSSRSRRSTDADLRGQQVQEGSCDCCCGNVVVHTAERNVATPDVDAYGFIQSGHPCGVNGLAAENFSPPGRLFKSRSDETLSAHSGRRQHQSMRHRKMKAPHVDTSGDRYWTMSKAQSRAREANRDHQRSSFQTQTDRRPYTYHEENDYILPSALRLERTEDASRGFVAREDYTRQGQFSNPASTVREKVEESYQNYGEVFRGSRERLNSSEIVFGPRSTCNDMSSTSKGPGLPLLQSSPFVVEEQLSDVVEVFRSSSDPSPGGTCHSNTPATSPVCTACRHDRFSSLQSTSNHPRADAGSNPDSGYGSKSYRTRGDLVMVFRPQDSNSSGKESKQSREDDKNSYGSSHWNTSECTVAPRIPNPDIVVAKPNECRQTQQPSSRKNTSNRQQSFREITTSPSCHPSRLPSANDESLKPVLSQHASSKNRVATGRCPSERPTSWCGHHQELSCSRTEKTFSSNQAHHHRRAEVYDAQIHQGTSRDVIAEDTMAHSSGNTPRPEKPSKHRDRPTSYQQYEPTATRHGQRSFDQPVEQNDRHDQSDKLKYGRQYSERDARQGNRQGTPRQRQEQDREEFHETENLQSKVYSLNGGGQRQSIVDIGRSTTV